MTPHPEHPVELVSAYADGELAPTERRHVEAHLAECPDCRRLYEDIVAMARSEAEGEIPAVPPGLAERIGERLDAAGAPRRKAGVPAAPRPRRWRVPAAAAAALAALAVIGVVYRESRESIAPRPEPKSVVLEHREAEPPAAATAPEPRADDRVAAKTAPAAPPAFAPAPPVAETPSGSLARERAHRDAPARRRAQEKAADALAEAPAGPESNVAASAPAEGSAAAGGAMKGEAAPRPLARSRVPAPDAQAPTAYSAESATARALAPPLPPQGHENDRALVLLDGDAPAPANAIVLTWPAVDAGAAHRALVAEVEGLGGTTAAGALWVPVSGLGTLYDWLKAAGVNGLPPRAAFVAAGTAIAVRFTSGSS